MSIWIDKNGQRHVAVMAAGRRIHRRMPQGSTASDAKRVESDLRAATGRRSIAIPGDPPLSAIMELYTAHAAKLRSPKTAIYHALRIGRWCEGNNASQARIVAASIVRDMTGHYQPATINRSLSALKKALALAWDRGIVPENYGARIKRLPEHNMRHVTLTLEQVAKVAEHASEQVETAIWIALYTGMRRGEILALQAADVGQDAVTVRSETTKAQRTRTVPIIAIARPWLAKLPLTINFEGLKTGFRRAREAAGLPHVTFHDLRRSCGSLMIQAGVDLYVVSKVLGHSGVAVTAARYAHMQIDRMRDGLERTFAPAIAPARKPRKAKAA